MDQIKNIGGNAALMDTDVFAKARLHAAEFILNNDLVAVTCQTEGAAHNYNIVNPFKDQIMDVARLHAGAETSFNLKPLEVLVIEAWPDDSLPHSSR